MQGKPYLAKFQIIFVKATDLAFSFIMSSVSVINYCLPHKFMHVRMII